MKNKFHNILAINFLYTFLNSAVVMLLPLYMIEKGFPIESIGLVLAAMPITFLVFRLLFSTIADQIGSRSIFVANAFSNLAAIMVYLIAVNPFMFAVGRLVEGVKASAFWAVNRTEIFVHSKRESVQSNAVKMVGIRSFADALGRLAIGLFATYLSFQNILVGLGFISLILFYFAQNTSKNGVTSKTPVKDLLWRLFKPRKFEFWFASNSSVFFGAVDYVIFVFVLPIYMATVLNMSYFEVGAMIAWVSIVFSIAVFFDSKFNLSQNQSIVLILLLSAIPLFFLFGADKLLFIILLTVFAFGWGIANSFYEKIVVWTTGKSRDVSTEVAVFHASQRIAEMIIVASIGFIVRSFGFSAVFGLCGLITILYLLNSIFVTRWMAKSKYLSYD